MNQVVVIDILGQEISVQDQAAIRKGIAGQSNGPISVSSVRFKIK